MLGAMETWRTGTLTVRPYREGDEDALVDFYTREPVLEFLGEAMRIPDRAAATAFIAHVHTRHGHYPAGSPFGYWTVTKAIDGVERTVATAMLKPAPDAARVPTEDIEVGWHVHPDFWRQGIATELARALIERGFTRTDETVLHAVIDTGNGASRSVARRAGMHRIGVTSKFYGLTLEQYVIDRASWAQRTEAIRRAFSVAIFARHEGRVLLVKHKRLGTWLPVGGEVEANETPLEAARRELFEETGLEGAFPEVDDLSGAPLGLIGYEEHVAGKKGLHLNFCFLCDVDGGDVKLDDSLEGHRWCSIDDGPWDEAPLNVRQLVSRALRRSSSR